MVKIQNHMHYFVEFSHSGLPNWEYERVGISKIFLLVFTLFPYIYPGNTNLSWRMLIHFELKKHVFSGDFIKDFVTNADRTFWRPRIDFEDSVN